MPRRLEAYIDALFNHDEAKGEWCFEDQDEHAEKLLGELEIDDGLVVEILDTAFNDFDSYLVSYSPWQIGTGMYCIFSSSLSNLCFAFQSPDVPIDSKVSAVGGLRNIFDKVFEPHCKPPPANITRGSRDLNDICIMLWEVTPLMSLGVKELCQEAIAVMSHCLDSPNPVVVESGLHGLGHAVCDFPEARRPIEKFISESFHTNQFLLDYAHNARTGSIL